MNTVWSSIVACAGALSLAGSALAAGTMTDGNASLALIGTPSYAAASGDANLITDPAAVDPLFKYTWYYRQPVNNTNRLLGAFSSDVSQDSAVGNTHTYQINNTGGGSSGVDRVTVKVVTTLTDGASPGQASVVSLLTATNPNSLARTFEFFAMVDWDIPGTNVNNAPDDVGNVLNNSEVRLQQIDTTTPGRFAEVLGVGASRYEMNSGSSLRTKLGSGSQNLTTASGTTQSQFSGLDVCFAIQYSITLQPGESKTVALGYAYNMTAVPAPGSAALAGLIGLAGLRRRRA